MKRCNVEQLIDPQSDKWVIKKGLANMGFGKAVEAAEAIKQKAPWCKMRIVEGAKVLAKLC